MFLTKADLCSFFFVRDIVYLFFCDCWDVAPMKSYNQFAFFDIIFLKT